MHTISASLIISMNLIMRSVLVCNFSLSFLLLRTAVFVGTVANIFLVGKKTNCALLIVLLKCGKVPWNEITNFCFKSPQKMSTCLDTQPPTSLNVSHNNLGWL